MQLKTIQWNIGGAIIRDQLSDPVNPSSYAHNNLEYIAEVINQYKPDIVTIQEAHLNSSFNQIETLANLADFDNYCINAHDTSHLDPEYMMGQGILSRFPINNHSFLLLTNPQLTTTKEDGSKMVSQHKGITRCRIVVNNLDIDVFTLHLFPFRKFNTHLLNSDLDWLRSEIVHKLLIENKSILIQGDFNIDDESLVTFFPELFDKGIKEVLISEPTTPRDRKYDHILYRRLKVGKFTILNNTLTDHYPLYCEFEVL